MIGVIFVIALFLAVCILCIYAFSKRIRKYEFLKNLGKRGILLSWLIAFASAAILTVIAGISNAVVIILHLLAFLGLCCFVAFIIKKSAKKILPHHYADIGAIVITVVYLCIGSFLMVHIFRTEYVLETEKTIGQDLRIVQTADFHIGTIMDGESVEELVERINAENPDIVVIIGDFADDGTEKEDMIASCKALGKINAKYGTYFVFGNHDEGYFNSRNFSGDELKQALKENGIRIMEDDTVAITEKIYLLGRKDASDKDRKSISRLMKNIPSDCYTIVLDHQPNDYDNQASAEVDLVLSGHTHGGHMFPAGYVGVLMGANDAFYGLNVRDNTSFIVSSGVSGWEIPFKTGTKSEYVVIDIKQSE